MDTIDVNKDKNDKRTLMVDEDEHGQHGDVNVNANSMGSTNTPILPQIRESK